jgi:LicD family
MVPVHAREGHPRLDQQNRPLIGWFWNGEMLPWDNDIDVQVLYSDFKTIFDLNSTIYNGRYLIDVNSAVKDRLPVGVNTSNARFIDTKTGLYIDLTAVVFYGGRLMCKDTHYYSPDDLFPLHLTTLIGVSVFRPHEAMKILVGEYREYRLTMTLYYGWFFHEPTRKWYILPGPM